MAKNDLGDGRARLVLKGVVLLHREDSMFEAMLSGWARQQRGRRLKVATIADHEGTVRRFFAFNDEYPWNWMAGQVDEWMSHLVVECGIAKSTIRNYQGALRMFCDYITSPYYQWPGECEEQFRTHPVQVCHEWNTAAHLADYEGGADRRPMTGEEFQEFFDYADAQVQEKIRHGKKGALGACRDATVFKILYGWGLRVNEVSHLDTHDFYRNPAAPEFGKLGRIHVRYGKSKAGSPPSARRC